MILTRDSTLQLDGRYHFLGEYSVSASLLTYSVLLSVPLHEKITVPVVPVHHLASKWKWYLADKVVIMVMAIWNYISINIGRGAVSMLPSTSAKPTPHSLFSISV